MHKDLKIYQTYIQSRLSTLTEKQTERLLRYHIERVRDFQHERQVHLFVTLFFGGLVVAGVVAVFILGLAKTSSLIAIALNLAVALLIITELCYVGYYYMLENGVQRLYKLTEQLHHKTDQS